MKNPIPGLARSSTGLGISIDAAEIFLAQGAVSRIGRFVEIAQASVQPLYSDIRLLEFLVATIVVEISGNAAEFAGNLPAPLLVQLLSALV